MNDMTGYDRHEFVTSMPLIAVPCVVILVLASIIGTLGNIMILIIIATKKEVRNVESVFIVNLAISDLYVTVVADPMSIVAKLEGEHFFDNVPGLCQTIASICTISCVSSLMTIAAMSVNRYFFICKHDIYKKIFTSKNCVLICISLYMVGAFLVLLNIAGIGDHTFDKKSLECIWDRMATFPYTVVFSVTLVWIPSLATGISYLMIYLYVRAHRRKIVEQQQHAEIPFGLRHQRNLHLAKTLFTIFIVFFICWAPYALLMVIDTHNRFPHAVHVYITVFAHLHPSLNWLIYYLTNKRFADAYKELLSNCGLCRSAVTIVTTFASSQMDNQPTVRRPRNSRSLSKSLKVPNRNNIAIDSTNDGGTSPTCEVKSTTLKHSTL